MTTVIEGTEKDVLTDAVKAAVKQALREELNAFYVDRETHYQHHIFLKGMIAWSEQCKSIALKTIVSGLVGGLIALIIIGFSIWGRGK